MMKKCLVLVIAMMLLLSLSLANAQSAPSASVTIGSVVPSTGSIVTDPEKPQSEALSNVVITLKPVVPTETTEEGEVPGVSEKQQEILTQITEIVQTQSQPVVEYFAPEVVESVQQLLPEETDVSTLQMDEFFQLKVEGYVPTLSDAVVESEAAEGEVPAQNIVPVAFEFTTAYKEDDQLVGMVGILPSDAKEVSEALKAAGLEELGNVDENGVFWLAVKAEVIDGKVVIHLPQGVLELSMDFETVFALFAARDTEALAAL